MIKLAQLLVEMDSFAKKQLDHRSKFSLVNEQSSDVQFKLSSKQFKELSKITSDLGGDLSTLVDSNLDEREDPNILGMSSDDMESQGIVLTIDKSIFDNLDDFIKLGLDAKDWYHEMNAKILESFGDSDGCLLLILLAIFSPRNKLVTNLRLAAQTYCGIKRDIADKELLPKFEEFIQLSSADAYKKIKLNNEYKELATVRGMMEGARSLPTYLSNLMRVLRMYKDNNYSFNQLDVTREIASHLRTNGKLDKTTVISAEKVFSFTLNLLDPTYKFEDSGWLPATIDTWMAAFFWPHLSKKEQLDAIGKSNNYVYTAKLTQQLASRYNMQPLQMQAVIWVAMIRKKQGPNYDVTFNTAIKKNLARLKMKLDELEYMDKLFSKVILAIGCGL